MDDHDARFEASVPMNLSAVEVADHSRHDLGCRGLARVSQGSHDSVGGHHLEADLFYEVAGESSACERSLVILGFIATNGFVVGPDLVAEGGKVLSREDGFDGPAP
jgi:hypothetical protein